jgi:hypothetical protein
MSSSGVGRVRRVHCPERSFTKYTYRQALPFLRSDFADRCAYSMQHYYHTGGLKCMEVDHFNPHLKKETIHAYDNLFLASRHCNGAKGDYWPDDEDVRKGLRFLNPCTEIDYGIQLLEDSVTHELVGTTPAGRFHIHLCDLNAPHLIEERRLRFHLGNLNRKLVISEHEVKQLIDRIESFLIPAIPLVNL